MSLLPVRKSIAACPASPTSTALKTERYKKQQQQRTLVRINSCELDHSQLNFMVESTIAKRAQCTAV